MLKLHVGCHREQPTNRYTAQASKSLEEHCGDMGFISWYSLLFNESFTNMTDGLFKIYFLNNVFNPSYTRIAASSVVQLFHDFAQNAEHTSVLCPKVQHNYRTTEIRVTDVLWSWRDRHIGAWWRIYVSHYNDVIMGAIASQITSLTIALFTVYSGADQRKHQSSVSLAFVRGIHRWPVNSPHKWPVTRKMLPFDDVIMSELGLYFFMQWLSAWLNQAIIWSHTDLLLFGHWGTNLRENWKQNTIIFLSERIFEYIVQKYPGHFVQTSVC